MAISVEEVSRAQIILEAEDEASAVLRKSGQGLDEWGAKAEATRTKSEGLTGGLGKLGGGLTSLISPVGLVAGGVGLLAGGLMEAVRAADEEQQRMARLYTTLQNSIPGWTGNTAAVEQYIDKQTKLAFADDALRDSLNLLVAQTGNLAEAQNLQSVAMDLARS